MNLDDWNLEEYNQEKTSSWVQWIKDNWEATVSVIVLGCLLILAICSFFQLIFTIKLYYKPI